MKCHMFSVELNIAKTHSQLGARRALQFTLCLCMSKETSCRARPSRLAKGTAAFCKAELWKQVSRTLPRRCCTVEGRGPFS